MPDHRDGRRWEPYAVDGADVEAARQQLQRLMRDAEADDRHPSGRLANFRVEGLDGQRHADPDDPSFPELGHQAGPPFLLAAKRGPAPVLLELPQEPGPGQSPLVAGHLGAEHLHQRRRPGLRHAEEPLAVAPGERGPVELLELADVVGDGEQCWRPPRSDYFLILVDGPR